MEQFLVQPLLNGLMLFYRIFGDLGIAIILLTLVIRLILFPLTVPSIKAQKKMMELAPEIAKLKEKYGTDKQKLAAAQMELYKKNGANPAAGCLPQIVQLVILIGLYQAFSKVLLQNGIATAEKLNQLLYPLLKLPIDAILNTNFLGFINLTKPDVIHISGLPTLPGVLLILAALTQLLSSKMMMPIVKKEEQIAAKTKEKTDDMAASMQSQMLYLFPIMTILIGFTFPSGLVLYWFVFSLFTMIQQYIITGLGGLAPWVEKIKLWKK